MTYLGEIRVNWRYLAAAALGQAAGYSLINYVGNVFTPHLINEFGWPRSQIALVGTVIFVNILAQPVAGRLADAFGVRKMATVGVVSMPLIFLGLSAMTGPVWQFFALTLGMVVIVGGTTSATIYSRLLAQKFNLARGISLAIAASAPPLAGAACVPFLSELIDSSGWRAGYIALALGSALIGITALALIPKGTDAGSMLSLSSVKPAKVYGPILRARAFQIIVVGLILCNLSFSMQTTQLKVILLDRGVDNVTSSLAISLFAIGVISGRLLCGLALDRFPAYAVVAISLGLPGIGLLLLGWGVSFPMMVAVAVLLLGLGLGAEGDVLAYLVMRYFPLEVYSTVLGMVFGALALSIASGALLLSFMLKISETYTSFLFTSGTAAILGGLTFLQLKRLPIVR
jgi:MFS family permease